VRLLVDILIVRKCTAWIIQNFCHCNLSSARWNQPTPFHHVSFKIQFILAYHLYQGLPSGLFLSGFSTKFVRISNLSFILYIPTNQNLLKLISILIFGSKYKLCSNHAVRSIFLLLTVFVIRLHTDRTATYLQNSNYSIQVEVFRTGRTFWVFLTQKS
jgi:uncharacterized membrane protein